jgi:hypothetical protein
MHRSKWRQGASSLLAFSVRVMLFLAPFPIAGVGSVRAADVEAAEIIDANSTMRFFVVEVPDSVGGGFEPHILAAPGVDGVVMNRQPGRMSRSAAPRPPPAGSIASPHQAAGS